MDYTIEHNSAESRFEAKLDNEIIGLIDYYFIAEGVIEIPHTEVSSRHEGKGIAAALNKSLLDYIQSNGYKVLPTCSYTSIYMVRHPEYSSLIHKPK